MNFAYYIILVCVLLVLYTYALYPLYLKYKVSRSLREMKKSKEKPHVSILMAAHNEESVIAEKIKSITDSNYPQNKITIYVGNDSSTDSTHEILKGLSRGVSNLVSINPEVRMGKPAMINLLAEKALEEHGQDQVFVLTDANVLFAPENISALVAHTRVENIGLVASNVKFKLDSTKSNVASTENTYNEGELSIKYAEGLLWGTMMGPFGACFAMKAELWRPVPDNFIVDDFWTNMSVLQQGAKSIMAREALSFEKITGDASVEYRRKVRMSMGNFQNLKYFRTMLFSKIRGLAFTYWSHKVLRWFTPFFLLIGYMGLLYISIVLQELKSLMIVIHIVLLLCALDPLFEKANIRTGPIRAVRHFLLMNIAMLQGYIQFWSGDARSIWEPTQREKK